MTEDEYASQSDCDMCHGAGYTYVTGMLAQEMVPCWMCNTKGKQVDAEVRGEEIRGAISAATAVARERDRPKNKGDRLAFAIQHATDGVCP